MLFNRYQFFCYQCCNGFSWTSVNISSLARTFIGDLWWTSTNPGYAGTLQLNGFLFLYADFLTKRKRKKKKEDREKETG